MIDTVGYATTTYRMRLDYKHLDWLEQTKEIYNRIVKFYYCIIMNDLSILELSNQKLLRELEVRTITSRAGVPPINPLPYKKVASLFRRSAINGAVGLARSYYELLLDWNTKNEKMNAKGKIFNKAKPSPTNSFNGSPVFYKGMYKNVSRNEIILKLWNGSSWVWVKHKYHGRQIDKNSEMLSPTLVLKGKVAMLHIPIVQKVTDTRNVKERIKDCEKVCAVAFSGSDVLATCSLHDSDGRVIDSYFIRGGKECTHRRKRLLGKIEHNKAEMGYSIYGMHGNNYLWKKIKNINEYYAHIVSRRIIDYCVKNDVKIITAANQSIINENSSNNYSTDYSSFTYLGSKILQYTKYKAWQKGIIVSEVRPYYTANKCHVCRAYIKKYNEGYSPKINFYGGKNFICPNGHQGNSYLNTSKNIGRMFYKKFGKEIA